MIGIYKITNKLNGRCYIGQSKHIEERFKEHVKDRSSSKKMQKEFEKYGIENFEFEVLEECDQSELLEKERKYISELKPYYNIVDKKDGEFNKLVSEGNKRWWKTLDDSTKLKIRDNLKGYPEKGHPVSKETREKISKKISEIQGKKVMIVETGQVFDKIKDMEEYLGAYNGTYYAYKKGKIKSVKGYHVVEV